VLYDVTKGTFERAVFDYGRLQITRKWGEKENIGYNL
jgi:hypothetical protein